MLFHRPIIDIVNSTARLKIVKFLLSHDAPMSEREIASILRISHMNVNRTMRALAGINFADYAVVGGAHVWKVRRKSYAFRTLSELVNGLSSIKNPIDDLKRTVKHRLSGGLAKKVVLFGSVCIGSERPDSDIDCFILVKNQKDKKLIDPIIDKLSNDCFDLYGNRLAPYILTEQEFSDKKTLKIVSEIENGDRII